MAEAGVITPRMGLYDKPFWEYLRRKEFRLQQCSGCGKFRFPPGPVCDACLSSEYSWEPLSGTGKVLSWVVFHRQYLPAYPVPYNVAVVQLDEGPLFVANLVGIELDDIDYGLPVRVVYDESYEDIVLPRFEPLPGTGE